MPTIDEAVALPATAAAVVVAGPGTGKTRRLGERIVHLTGTLGMLHQEIRLLTLTRETVRSLRKRIPNPVATTFHAFALNELNRIGDATRKQIADPWEQRYLVAEDMKVLAARSGLPIRVDAVPTFLRRLGAGFRDTQLADPELSDQERVLRTAWYRVRDFLSLRLLDELAYDLMGHLTNGWNLPKPPVALLVDEYQDLTPVELQVLRLVSERHSAGIFVCGDDRQSIYGFRDADELGLNNFGKIYGVEPTYLSKSYRCPTRVLALAEEIARRMPAVPGLTARPTLQSAETCGEGEVRIATFKSLQAEALWVVDRICERHKPTDDESTDRRAAIIAPRDVDVYVEALNRAAEVRGVDLSFSDARDQQTFVDDHSFRAAYALLRLAVDEEDLVAWRTLIEVTDDIGEKTVLALYEAGPMTLLPAIRAAAASYKPLAGLRDAALIARERLLAAEDPGSAWEILREAVPAFGAQLAIADTWRRTIEETTVDEEGKGVIPQLLARFRECVFATVADQAPPTNQVLVYTIFGSKGQQWPHVFIMGAYAQGFQDGAAADGLRKLYVTLTRATHTMTVTMPRFVGYTTLAKRLPSIAPGFLPDLADAIAACHLTIEVDPDH